MKFKTLLDKDTYVMIGFENSNVIGFLNLPYNASDNNVFLRDMEGNDYIVKKFNFIKIFEQESNGTTNQNIR